MERVVNPGPIDRTLLLSQHEHKSELLWKGEISFTSLMRTVWCWERILPVQPSAPPPHDGDVLLPYARRWTGGIDRDTESHHVVIPIRDQLDRMTKDQSLAVEVDDGTRGAGYKLWYMRYRRLLIGKHALEVDVPSGFVHSAGTSIAMSRGLFKLHSLALQWQRDTALASHGEEGDPLFEHIRARGPRRGRVDGQGRGREGHRGRARRRALGRGAGGIPIPPDIEAEAGVEADDLHIHQFGTSDIMNLLDMSFGDYIPDMAGTSGTAHCDTEDTALYNTQDFIEGLLDDPIESQIHTTGPSSTVEESPTTIIEDVVPTVNEDPNVIQIHTMGPSSTVEESPTTNIEDVVPTVNEDPNVTQTTMSPLSSPDVTFIMPMDDMPQTPGRKKVVKRIVKNVNIKDLPAKKRKRDNEDEDGYTELRPRDVLRISRKGCGT
uniref:Uncharacterized protein n=1 Tax=Solanum tuberosum TaxID=4113 RepID=M1DRH1_SOLTU